MCAKGRVGSRDITFDDRRGRADVSDEPHGKAIASPSALPQGPSNAYSATVTSLLARQSFAGTTIPDAAGDDAEDTQPLAYVHREVGPRVGKWLYQSGRGPQSNREKRGNSRASRAVGGMGSEGG